jgi:hypothetical protein
MVVVVMMTAPRTTSTTNIKQHPQLCRLFNPLLLLFKSLLHGQKDRVFFSGHLNLRTTPETGLPSRKKKS